MTDFEVQCYGMSEAEIREHYMNSLTARLGGLDMVIMSILSDCQEMLPRDAYCDKIRKQLNVAKFVLAELEVA